MTGISIQRSGHYIMAVSRYDLDRDAKETTQQWASLSPERKLGWPSSKTEVEKRWNMAYRSRKLQEDQVDEIESENRENIKQQLSDEDLQRLNAKPEPDAPEDTGLPFCDIPRCLIELTPDQMKSLEHEPARAPAKDKHTEILWQQSDEWRIRYLRSRDDMEKDPVTWLATKRGPTRDFEKWVNMYGFYVCELRGYEHRISMLQQHMFYGSKQSKLKNSTTPWNAAQSSIGYDKW